MTVQDEVLTHITLAEEHLDFALIPGDAREERNMEANISIAASLVAIAKLLDHVTRHGERLDVKVESPGY